VTSRQAEEDRQTSKERVGGDAGRGTDGQDRTHSSLSPVSDPSVLGSDTDSWLEYRNLRTGKMIQIVRTRVSRNCGSRSAVRR
jgi:hypothetical protein